MQKKKIHKIFTILEFCFQNCSDLLWEKVVLVIEKNGEFANVFRSPKQFIRTVKAQKNF